MKGRAEARSDIVDQQFQLCVIGGGATGSGCALDAQLRGLKTVLVNAGDFAGGTSSASTKIVHGGIRYLEQAAKELSPAQYKVVSRALHERIRMIANAPHLAWITEFVLPCFSWADLACYGIGLKLYDWIAGRDQPFPSHFLSKEATQQRFPKLKSSGLHGSVVYADGQFDDSRYNIALLETFTEVGGKALNYARVAAFEKDSNGRLIGAAVEDQLTGKKFVVSAEIFVNATGPFADELRVLATPTAAPRLRLSKGVHILLPLELMASDDALLLPKTEDGRVMFVLPWMGRLLVGTTEQEVSLHDELFVSTQEINYLLRHLNQYVERPVTTADVVSGFAGIRPLVAEGDSKATKTLARDDELEIDPKSSLISIMGGKWTTYRSMAEHTIDAVQERLGMSPTPSPTAQHFLAGAEAYKPHSWKILVSEYGINEHIARHLSAKFGARAQQILGLLRDSKDLGQPLCEGLPMLRAEVVYCVRNEMAVTIEDVLFRRIGLQQYSWRLAIGAAPVVASLLGEDLGWSDEEEKVAIDQYVSKISKYLQLAGLENEPRSGQKNDKTEPS